eukprot:1144174-Pelagomonas_calceolata.AAC.5
MHAHARTGARKVETDLAHARSRIVQLESSLRSKDRDHDKLGRTIEALKQEAAEAAARRRQRRQLSGVCAKENKKTWFK